MITLFEKISSEQNGKLDVLVNNCYAGVSLIDKSSGIVKPIEVLTNKINLEFSFYLLKGEFSIFIDFFFKGPIKTAPQEKNRGTTEKGLS